MVNNLASLFEFDDLFRSSYYDNVQFSKFPELLYYLKSSHFNKIKFQNILTNSFLYLNIDVNKLIKQFDLDYFNKIFIRENNMNIIASKLDIIRNKFVFTPLTEPLFVIEQESAISSKPLRIY